MLDVEVKSAGASVAMLFGFYVQGITDRGEVMEWEQCVFIDAS